jgi:class 3 adenylate cyclase
MGVSQRKTVTIVFSDIAGSTELGERLDPEAMQEVMRRYGSAMRAALEHHGGVVEKFIGDAVMAVFGIPLLHEDDAVRAVRAAVDMQAALSELNAAFDEEYGVRLDMRIGVHTGEVITSATTSDQALVAGDAVNAAARLQSAAPLGSVLIGPATYRLVAGVVESTPHGELSLRGKSQPLATWRVLGVASPPRAPKFEPIAGRGRELGRLARHLAEAADHERSRVQPE